MGFNYKIQYKCGKENLAADALSRVPSSEILCMAISLISSDLKSLIQASYQTDPLLSDVLATIHQGNSVDKYALVDGLLRRDTKIVVGSDPILQAKILLWQHSSPESGHVGSEATLKKLKSLFF